MPSFLQAIILPVLLAFSVAFFLFVCWAEDRQALRGEREGGERPAPDRASGPEDRRD